jgi:hypothetical protein
VMRSRSGKYHMNIEEREGGIVCVQAVGPADNGDAGPAAAAGLCVGDIIESINGTDVTQYAYDQQQEQRRETAADDGSPAPNELSGGARMKAAVSLFRTAVQSGQYDHGTATLVILRQAKSQLEQQHEKSPVPDSTMQQQQQQQPQQHEGDTEMGGEQGFCATTTKSRSNSFCNNDGRSRSNSLPDMDLGMDMGMISLPQDIDMVGLNMDMSMEMLHSAVTQAASSTSRCGSPIADSPPPSPHSSTLTPNPTHAPGRQKRKRKQPPITYSSPAKSTDATSHNTNKSPSTPASRPPLVPSPPSGKKPRPKRRGMVRKPAPR